MWFCCSGSLNALVWDVCGELKFPEVESVSGAPSRLQIYDRRNKHSTAAPKPSRTLSFLWHWPMKDLEGKRGSSRAKIVLYFPKFALFLEASNLWPIVLYFWLSLFLVSSALCSPIILFLRNGYQNAVGFNDAGIQNLCCGRAKWLESRTELSPLLV